MRATWRTGLLLGSLNGAVAVAVLGLVDWLTPGQVGWFAYAPLTDIVVQERPFPWSYVVVPVALVALNIATAMIYARRIRR